MLTLAEFSAINWVTAGVALVSSSIPILGFIITFIVTNIKREARQEARHELIIASIKSLEKNQGLTNDHQASSVEALTKKTQYLETEQVKHGKKLVACEASINVLTSQRPPSSE